MKNIPPKRTYLFYCLSLFLTFLLSSNLASAQIVLSTDDSNNGTKTISCPTSQSFTDDNSNSGNYFDDNARTNTIILCPNSNSFQIKVSFTSFDVASGDVLNVYDGDLSKNPGAPKESASGSGPSSAFGSWVQANCDPAINPTGCLTFEFVTNGDKNKGAGWQANITCETSSITVQCPSNISVSDDCNNLDGRVSVTIDKPLFQSCGGSSTSMVNITSSCSAITGGQVLADGGVLGTFNIPLGSYSITATSVADPTKTCTYFVTADQPTIACNDNVTASIGFGCEARVSVDDIIERPCVGSGTTYRIEVDLGTKGGGKATVTIDGSSQSSINSNALIIPSTDFNCGSEYPVTVTRIVNFTSCGGQSSLEKSCTGRVRFVDNSAPIIQLTAPTLTTCGGLSDAEIKSKLSIFVSDNCDVKDTIVSVGAFPSNFCAANLSVPITITAVDFCGNSDTKTFEVAITRPTNFFAPADTVLPCGSSTDPEVTGYPLLDTDGDGKGDLPIMHNTCNFIPTYTDQEVTAGNSKTIKIFRTWRVTDWCNQAGPVTLPTQAIEVKDTGNPFINCPSGNQRGTENNPHIVYTNSNDCSANINVTPPTGSDACGGSVTVTFFRAVNIWDDEVYTNLNADLEIGNYYAEYYGLDETGNSSDTCQVYFNIQDGGVPNAICTDELNVSFVNNVARVNVADIDGGSEGTCSSITKEIRKEGGQWGQTVTLTCDELTTSAKVYLRVRDVNGGENTCWTTIRAKDSTPPNCGDLDDQTIPCEDFHTNEFGSSTDTNDNKNFDTNEWQPLTGSLLNDYNQAFGNPNCADNLACGGATVRQEYQLIAAQCGETKIKRRYRATDGGANQSNWKEQNITLIFEPDFSVSFPADWEGNCGSNFPAPNLNLDAQGCNVLAWTSEDQRFDGVNGACYVIERTYSVTNWCLYSAGDDAFKIARTEDASGFSTTGATVTHLSVANHGLFEYVQVLKVTDDTQPTISVTTVDDCITGADCTDQKTFSITADDCLGTEGLTYGYELWNGGALVESGASTSFTATVSQANYQVIWKVQDNCGNTAWETLDYNFKDCKRPTPFCKEGIATVIDADTKTATVWAVDLNQKSEDNCTVQDKLEFRVWHPILANTVTKPQIGDDENVVLALPKNVTLDCDYFGTQAVELYVVDEAGNWDFCIASVFIQDVSGVCSNGVVDSTDVAMVSGGILSTSGIPLKNVQLTAKGTTQFEKTISTNDNGIFELDLPKGIGYILSFDKEDDMRNGLTVFDIILVSKHILGITPFDTPYKYIAADINRSGSVSAFDLVQMRKIILGTDIELANEPTWSFLSANYEFNGDFPAGEALGNGLLIPVLTENITELDFVGIKLGDIDGSVKVDGFASAEPRNEHNELFINLKDQLVKKGELVTVDFFMDDIKQLKGLQYELNFEYLTLASVQNGLIKSTHFNQKSTNALTVCWDAFSSDKENNNTNGRLFQLTFTANQTGQLSELLSLSSHKYSAAITDKEEVHNVALNFEKIVQPMDVLLYQNSPNPFAKSTTIGFELPAKGFAQLEIFNLQGALLHTTKGTFEKGYNEVILSASELASSGILLYQLKTEHGVIAKKMILVE